MPPALQTSPPTVILVEDDADVLESLKFTFEVEGFVVQAHTSAEALLAAGTPPESACLVLDYRLPGIDGLALLQNLREAGHDRPALLICTSSTEMRRRAALASVDIVEKPLLSDALINKVRDLLTPRRLDGHPR